MSKFDRFLRHRQSLLIQYKMGDMTKNEFIENNYRYMESLGIKPFTRIDNVKKPYITIIITMSAQNTGNGLPVIQKILRELSGMFN